MQRIAIVDDDDGLRRALAALLGAGSREVMGYGTAEEFLDAAATEQFDVAVFDLRLPGLTGINLLERLSPLTFPVVMISASGDVRAAVRSIKLGAVDFIEKPFTPDDLESLIETALQAPRDAVDPPTPRRKRKPPGVSGLTPRETEVALALTDGLTNKEVAHRLGCSPRTVEVHRSRVFSKLGVSSIAGLVRTVSGGAS